jgi:hypothetical protein
MVRLFLAAASLVRIEQQLTQGDENDDADERGATPPTHYDRYTSRDVLLGPVDEA